MAMAVPTRLLAWEVASQSPVRFWRIQSLAAGEMVVPAACLPSRPTSARAAQALLDSAFEQGFALVAR